jgi:FKBP-type peptidyl-prolyl cis-trans isomerase 2
MISPFNPGMYVRLPGQSSWGLGQVQSVDGNRVTVNFEHAGKKTVRTDQVELIPVGETNG